MMKRRDKHRRAKVPGATYQSCLSELGAALQAPTAPRGAGPGGDLGGGERWSQAGRGARGDRDFKASAGEPGREGAGN